MSWIEGLGTVRCSDRSPHYLRVQAHFVLQVCKCACRQQQQQQPCADIKLFMIPGFSVYIYIDVASESK